MVIHSEACNSKIQKRKRSTGSASVCPGDREVVLAFVARPGTHDSEFRYRTDVRHEYMT